MEADGDYVFLRLKDAKCAINQKVNLVGAVAEIGPPEESQGTDNVCTLKIVDSSCHESGISVKFFAPKAMLPCVKTSGDIICLKRVAMRIHVGEVYALFNKKFSSFTLFRRDDCGDINAYQNSSVFTTTSHDKTYIRQLQTWLIENSFGAGVVENILQLNKIGMGHYCNLVCKEWGVGVACGHKKILHVCELPGDGWLVYVWDGTDCPPLAFPTEPNSEGEAQLPLYLEPVSLPRSVLCMFPPVGTVLRVISVKSCKHLCGQWVKLSDVMCQVRSGLWCGVLKAHSKLILLSSEDEIVKCRQSYYKERQSCNLNRLPLSSFPWPSQITEIAHESAPFSTLMDVLTHSEVTFRYKCVARVITSYPRQIGKFASSVSGKYRIRFTLEDHTARIHAGLFDEDGEKFFGGYPREHVLTEKMNKLLGMEANVGLTSRNPPWVQLCLTSFYLDKNDKWGSRRYRITDTALVV